MTTLFGGWGKGGHHILDLINGPLNWIMIIYIIHILQIPISKVLT